MHGGSNRIGGSRVTTSSWSKLQSWQTPHRDCQRLIAFPSFHDGKKIQLPSFRDCLKEGGTVKKLAVGREAAIEVQESLLAMSKLREEVDLEKSRAKWDSADRDKDLEICFRAKNNAWVIARTPLMPLRGSAIASPVLKVTALTIINIFCSLHHP
ncbi:hypothetical protein Peur_018312 [Populus x canadensis]